MATTNFIVCGKCGKPFDRHTGLHAFDPVPTEIWKQRQAALFVAVAVHCTLCGRNFSVSENIPPSVRHCPKCGAVGNDVRQITEEQIGALRAFAARYGRSWKSVLREAWMSGNYPYTASDNDTALLQQVRNQFGPAWLVKHGQNVVRG